MQFWRILCKFWDFERYAQDKILWYICNSDVRFQQSRDLEQIHDDHLVIERPRHVCSFVCLMCMTWFLCRFERSQEEQEDEKKIFSRGGGGGGSCCCCYNLRLQSEVFQESLMWSNWRMISSRATHVNFVWLMDWLICQLQDVIVIWSLDCLKSSTSRIYGLNNLAHVRNGSGGRCEQQLDSRVAQKFLRLGAAAIVVVDRYPEF